MRIALCIALLTALAGAALAAEIPLDQRRSGYSFMSPDTRAMQDEDTANPGMLSVLDGEALWKRKAGTADKACADCHSDARVTMKGIAARYPAFEKALGRPVDLEGRINLCRANHQQASPFAYESRELLALTAYVAQQSRGEPIAAGDDPELTPFVEKGHALFVQRQGQLNRQLGQEARGERDHAGTTDRLSALPAGMAVARIAAAPAARLHHRHPGTGL
jgi:sulfur-oxidizing protein SoxA